MELELKLNENDNGSAEKSEYQRRNFVPEDQTTLSETVHWGFKNADGSRREIGVRKSLPLYPSRRFPFNYSHLLFINHIIPIGVYIIHLTHRTHVLLSDLILRRWDRTSEAADISYFGYSGLTTFS